MTNAGCHLDTGRWRVGLGLAFRSPPGAQARLGGGGQAEPGGSSAVKGESRGWQGSPQAAQMLAMGAPSGTGLPGTGTPAWRSSPRSSGHALLREEGGLCAHVQGGPGDPCTHVPGRPGGRLLAGGAGPLHLLAASHFVPALYVLPVLNVFFFKYISGKAVFSLLSCQVCVHPFRQ